MLKIKDCLEGDFITVGRGTPLKEIIKIFKEKKIHTLPVVEKNGNLAGEITLGEITNVFQPQSAEINKLLETIPFLDTVPDVDINIDYITPEMGILVVADEIMNTQYFTIGLEDYISKAYSIMKVNNRNVLMVTEGVVFRGVLSMFDIIYAMFREKGVCP